MPPKRKKPGTPPLKDRLYSKIKNELINQPISGSVITKEEKQQRKEAHCEPFMPRRVLESFVQHEKVKADLNGLLGNRGDNEELARYAVDRASRAFLTAIYAQAICVEDGEPCIKLLYDGDFRDINLPVHLVKDEDEDEFDPYAVCANESDTALECFSDWGMVLKERYEEKQWVFLAPRLDEDDFNYVFHEKQPIPFVYMFNPQPARGFFSRVFKLGLRTDHLRVNQRSFQLKTVPNEEHVEVAVKFITTDSNVPNSKVDVFYEREKQTLKFMRDLKHDHLIRAIATCVKGTTRCFIFPWAEGGNLADFWKNDRNRLDKYLVRWAIDQMAGISSGIMELHKKNTRHGDIKPQNILHFLDRALDKRGLGILKVADVGLAKVHPEYTKYRDSTTTRQSTERYEPPEMMSYIRKEAAIPRRYDSWSLGCVFLEFLVWLVHGQVGLVKFHEDLKPSHQERFYEVEGNSNVRHHVVNKVIDGLEKKLPDNTALGRILELISKNLLVPADKRMYTETLHIKLTEIIRECNNRSSYYFGSDLARLAEVRPVPGGISDDNRAPPDDHTSKIDNKWRDFKDSEWARFLISRVDFHSFRPNIETGFCDACSSIDFLANGFDLGRTLQDLQEGSEDCTMCAFLFRCFSTVSSETVVQGQQNLSLLHNNTPAISFYVDPDYQGPTPHQFQLGLPVLPSPGSAQEFALLNAWITLCDRNHDCIPEQSGPQEMPTRLIQVGTTDAPVLRLVETKQSNITGKYIALSHCWGKLSRKEKFCTYRDTIGRLKQQIPFDRLPQTFKDAVTTTRALNVEYLWIDSLCIIQEDADDWKIEAARMEDVFNSAYCTIAASSSTSSLGGFLGSRKERAVIGINTTKGPLYLAQAIDDFHENVEEGILNTRGWVFQERALSRRTIHFTSTQVYWECGHGVHCETLAHLRNRESELLGDSRFPNYGLQKYKDDSIRLVQYLFKTYSGLNLTNPTDRSQALLGLEKRLGRTFQTEAQYGILSAYFERLLLWQRDQPLPLDNIPYPEYEGTPSWSWMSLMGRISYLDVPFGKINWTGHVANPFDTDYSHEDLPWDGGLQAKAHKLNIGEDTLKSRVRTDLTHSKMKPKDFICVVVGTSKLTNDDGTTDQYVLLLRRMSLPAIYERSGVGILLDIHIHPESFPVYII